MASPLLYLVPVDLGKNELLNARVQNLAAAPGSPVIGQFYYDTVLVDLRVWTGSWQSTKATSVTVDDVTLENVGTAFAPNLNVKALGIANAQISASAAIALSKLATDPLARANHTGTQIATTISDFNTAVRLNTLNQMAVPTASVSFNSQLLTNVLDPTTAQDAATKAYVDSVASGLDVKASVRLATAAALAANTRTGNVLTASANGVMAAVDGVTPAVTDRILVKDEATGANNGIYAVTDVGSAGTPFILTRATDADASVEVTSGMFSFVEEGTVNADAGFALTTNAPITLNTTALVFSQFSGAGQITAGAGLTKTGNTIDVITASSARIVVNADSIDLAVSGISAGTYASVTVDTYGRSTAGVALTTKGDLLVYDGTAYVRLAAGTNDFVLTADSAVSAGVKWSAVSSAGTVGKYSALIGTGAATSITITQATHGRASDRTNVATVSDASTGAQVYCDVVYESNGSVTFGFTTAPASNSLRVTIMG